MKLRIKAYAPNGASLGILPAPSKVSASQVLGDTGGLSLEYGATAPRANVLDSPCELAVEVSRDNGVTWAEPDDCRYVYLRRKGDSVKRPTRTTAEAAAYSWRLFTAKVLPGGLLNADGKRPFLTATAGTIMRTLIQEAQARGALTGITFDFTTTLDSAGAAWSRSVTLYYEPGKDYLAILRNLFDQGLVDFRFRGRTLQMFNADSTMARRLDATNPVVDLRYGRDLTEAPYTGTWEALANFAYVEGDNGVTLERLNAAATAPWGRQETYIAQGGVSDLGTMATLADASLEGTAKERIERTYGLSLGTARWLPDLDYTLGDYVAVGDRTSVLGVMVPYRVRQITLTRDESGDVGGNAVLNDRFVEQDIRTTRRVNGITGGSTISGGSGAQPIPPAAGVDNTTPAQVTGLAAATVAYLNDQGQPNAQVTLSWSAVTTNTDGTACDDLARYEVYSWPTASPNLTRLTVAAIDAPGGIVSWSNSPYAVGSAWSFKVRAVDKAGHLAAFSGTTNVTMAADATPPTAPSAPTTVVRLGVVTMAWDGKDSGGNPMSLDTKRVDVHRSMVNAFTPDATTLAGSLAKAGVQVFAGQAYGTTWYYRLVALDTSGNASAPSVQGSAVTTPLVASDLVGSPIPGSALVSQSITAREMRANSITVDALAAGSVTATILSSDAIDGKVITGAVIRTSAAGARFEVDTFGARLYDAAGNLDVNLPTDSDQAAYFAGDILATGLTIVDYLSLQGVNNEFAAQSVTTLQAGVTAPSSAPAVALGFPEVPVSSTNYDGVNYYRGFWATPGGGGFSRGWLHYNPYSATDYSMKFHVERFNFAGNLLSTTVEMGYGSDDVMGACEVGGRISILSTGYQARNYGLRNFDAITGAPGSSGFVDLPVGSYDPTIFADASWVYVAYMTATQVVIQRRDPGTLTVLGTYTGANGGLKRALTSGMGPYNFDYGSARFILTTDVVGAWGYAFTISGSTLTLAQTNDSWPIPKGEVPHGIAWDGTRFWSAPLDRPERWLKLSTINWTTESPIWWAAYAWYHTTNGWQTKVSPLARFAMAKRAWITLTAQTFPNITAPGVPPDSVMTYMINNAITPSTAILKHPAGTPPVAGQRTYVYDTYPFVGTSPVTVGTFPVLVAGLIRSSALRANQTPKWSLSGDGTALFQDMEVSGYLRNQPTTQRGNVSLAATVASTGALSGSVVFNVQMVSPPTVTMTAASSRLTCSVSGMTINGFNWSVNNWSPGGTGATTAGWIAQC